MTRKRPSRCFQWAKKGQKCDVSRKICPSLFFRRGSDRREGPGGLKKIPYTTPYTALAACGWCSWVRMAGKSPSRGPQTQAKGQDFTSPLLFLHPLTFAGARTARKGPFCQCQARISGPLSFLRGLGPRGGYVLAAFAAPLPLSHAVCHIAGKVSFFGVEFFFAALYGALSCEYMCVRGSVF